MNGRGLNRTLMVAALLVLVPVAALCGPPQVDLKRLATDFDNWQTAASGEDFIYLANITWAAHTIFWGPVPESMPKTIDQAFVLETMNRFFSDRAAGFVAEDGEKLKVHGHKGFAVSGTEGDGVAVRYGVFHCDKSDRVFLSRIERQTGLGTPEITAERLLEIERTISCHGVNRRINNPKVPLKMNFPALNLVFFIPEGWRSDIYRENSCVDEGAVWTLPMNSVHKIYYATMDASGTDAAAAAAETLAGFGAQLMAVCDGRTVEMTPDADGVPTDLGGRHLLRGTALVKDQVFDWESGEHRFRLHLWEKGGQWHGLLYDILSRSEFEGRKVYLQPDESMFLELEERLSKAVNGFPTL